jgi:hypothetical protein
MKKISILRPLLFLILFLPLSATAIQWGNEGDNLNPSQVNENNCNISIQPSDQDILEGTNNHDLTQDQKAAEDPRSFDTSHEEYTDPDFMSALDTVAMGDETSPGFVSDVEDKKTEPDPLNAWPLFHYSQDDEDGSVTLSILGPIFYFHRSGNEKLEYGLRPLFYVHKDKKNDTDDVDFLYPIGKYKRDGEDKNLRIVPIIRDSRYELACKRQRISHDYFPIFWGRSEEGENYFGIFPIYGTVKNRFGKDDIFFLLWPFYSRTKEDEFVTNSLFWPVFSRTKGEDRWGVKIFPLWGHEEITGVKSETFYLFPLITFREKDLDTEAPITEKIFIPFYSVQKTPYSKTTSVLWPLFTYARDDRFNYRKYDIPWPIYRRTRSDTTDLIQLFPFYQHEVTTKGDEVDMGMYILYPIYKREHFASPKKTEDTYRFMLVNKFNKTKITDGGDELWVYIFPLYNRRKYESGRDTSSFLYPLPLYDDGFKRNLLPLFELYSRNRDEDGNETTNILYNLYINSKYKGVEYTDIPLFYLEKKVE